MAPVRGLVVFLDILVLRYVNGRVVVGRRAGVSSGLQLRHFMLRVRLCPVETGGGWLLLRPPISLQDR